MSKFTEKIFSIKYNSHKRRWIIHILGIRFSPKRTTKSKIEEIREVMLEEILPYVRNVDFKQNLLLNYYYDVTMAKKANGGLAKRQAENFELLKEFVRICDKHNLPYWIDWGTLLGQTRHKDFIPWDDDADVSMLDEDLIKLREIVDSELGKQFTCRRTEYGLNSNFLLKENTGACLDIFSTKSDDKNIYYNGPCASEEDRIPISKDIMFPLKKEEFLGLSVNVPANKDAYLRLRYGNYMQFPSGPHLEEGHFEVDEHHI